MDCVAGNGAHVRFLRIAWGVSCASVESPHIREADKAMCLVEPRRGTGANREQLGADAVS